jgi:hypothetical protein
MDDYRNRRPYVNKNYPPTDQAPDSMEDRIVREVVRRLQSLATIPPAGSADVLPAEPLDANDAHAQPLGAQGATIRTPVVALAALTELPEGVRKLRVAQRAVLTPSAAEWIRHRGIQVERITEPPSHCAPLVLVSDTPGRACERARRMIQQIAGPLDYRADRCPDALSRHVAQQVAGDKKCVWLTERPAVALCRSNRMSGVRAAWALDAVTVRAAVDQLHANVWITEPARHTAAQWNHLLRITSIT